MTTAVIRIEGVDAAEAADALGIQLAASLGDEAVAPVQVLRDGAVVAVLGLLFAGISAADVVWGWWQARQSQGVSVRIETSDGASVELSNASRADLEALLEKIDDVLD